MKKMSGALAKKALAGLAIAALIPVAVCNGGLVATQYATGSSLFSNPTSTDAGHPTLDSPWFSGMLLMEAFAPGGGFSPLAGRDIDTTISTRVATDWTLVIVLKNDALLNLTDDPNGATAPNTGDPATGIVYRIRIGYPQLGPGDPVFASYSPEAGTIDDGQANTAAAISNRIVGSGSFKSGIEFFFNGINPGRQSEAFFFTWTNNPGVDLTSAGTSLTNLVGDRMTYSVFASTNSNGPFSQADSAILLTQAVPIPEPGVSAYLAWAGAILAGWLQLRRRLRA